MPRPNSNIAHTLNALKGWGANPHAVDMQAALDSAVTYDVYSGRAMYLSAIGVARPGCHNTAMTLFAFPNSYDTEVIDTYAGNPASPGNDSVWVDAGQGAGSMLMLPAAGAYELATTEYDTTVSASSYTPAVTLTAAQSTTDIAVGGVLKPGIAYSVPICGVVSRGVGPSGYGGLRKSLAFWPVYLPKLAKTTITLINAET